MLLRKHLYLFALIVASFVGQGAASQAAPPCQNVCQTTWTESYSDWVQHPDRPGVLLAEYDLVVRKTVGRRIVESTYRHYVVRYANDPTRCYCYNRSTRRYWGRWNLGGPQPTFSRVGQEFNFGDVPPTEIPFQGQEIDPLAPTADVPMTAPPDDLPPA